MERYTCTTQECIHACTCSRYKLSTMTYKEGKSDSLPIFSPIEDVHEGDGDSQVGHGHYQENYANHYVR